MIFDILLQMKTTQILQYSEWFFLKEKERLNMKPFRPKTNDFNNAITKLWIRLKGI